MRTHSNRGLTLIEVIVAISLLAIISVWTMEVIGNGRALQGRARDKADLLFVVQSELDRLRVDTSSWQAGEYDIQEKSDWPSETKVTSLITDWGDGIFLLEIEATRESADGFVASRLATLVGGTP